MKYGPIARTAGYFVAAGSNLAASLVNYEWFQEHGQIEHALLTLATVPFSVYSAILGERHARTALRKFDEEDSGTSLEERL